MRKTVQKAWQTSVDKAMRLQFPDFVPYAKRERGEPRGMLKYVWKASESLWCFIAFRPVESEAFDLWVGWSAYKRFPFANAPKIQVLDGSVDYDLPEAMVSSMDLVPRQGMAHWSFWNPDDEIVDDPEAFARAFAEQHALELTDEQAMTLVAPAVTAAFGELAEYGLPFLREKVRRDSARK